MFGPLRRSPKEMLAMGEDELEALYLADFRGLYQETCAKELGVSRPTFAKLIKSARRKCAQMLLHGKGIELTSLKTRYLLAYPTDDRVTIHAQFLVARFFAFATVENDTILSIAYKENPIYQKLQARGMAVLSDENAGGMAAGRIIPPLLRGADVLAVRAIGEGIRHNLEGSGLDIEVTDAVDVDTLVKQLFASV